MSEAIERLREACFKLPVGEWRHRRPEGKYYGSTLSSGGFGHATFWHFSSDRSRPSTRDPAFSDEEYASDDHFESQGDFDALEFICLAKATVPLLLAEYDRLQSSLATLNERNAKLEAVVDAARSTVKVVPCACRQPSFTCSACSLSDSLAALDEEGRT